MMNQHYTERLLPVLVHIQNHLDGDLTLHSLADLANFSPFHFHRLFRESIGETLKQYIQRLRLEWAATQLALRDATILAIALDSGFKNHETFTRAFKRRFGRTPEAYKKKRNGIETTIRERALLNRMTQGYEISKVRVHKLKPINLAFIRNLGPYVDVDMSLFDRLIAWCKKKGFYNENLLLIGIGHDSPSITPVEKLRFDACIQVPDRFRSEGDIGFQNLPSGLFATTTYIGPYGPVMEEAYREIFEKAAGLKHYQITGLPVVEIYRTTKINPDYALNQTDIYLPIRKSES